MSQSDVIDFLFKEFPYWNSLRRPFTLFTVVGSHVTTAHNRSIIGQSPVTWILPPLDLFKLVRYVA